MPPYLVLYLDFTLFFPEDIDLMKFSKCPYLKKQEAKKIYRVSEFSL